MSDQKTAGIVSEKNDNATDSVNNPTADSGVTEATESIESLKFRLSKALQQRDEVRGKLDKKSQADEDARLKKMEEDGKFKETIADLKGQLSTAKKRADAFDEFETKSRAEIMEQLKEEDQEIAKGISSLSGLQKFYNRIKVQDATRVPTQSGTPSKNTVLDKPFDQMSEKEKESNWSSILQSFRK